MFQIVKYDGTSTQTLPNWKSAYFRFHPYFAVFKTFLTAEGMTIYRGSMMPRFMHRLGHATRAQQQATWDSMPRDCGHALALRVACSPLAMLFRGSEFQSAFILPD